MNKIVKNSGLPYKELNKNLSKCHFYLQ